MKALALALAITLGFAAPAAAEILVRWDQDRVPAMLALGIDALVIPADRTEAIRHAAQQGYRVFLEVEAGKLASLTVPPAARGGVVVRGTATSAQLRLLRAKVGGGGARVLTLEERGKWPHVRLNAVTKRGDVLQVAGRSAQPWLENNGALARIAGMQAEPSSLLSYPWTPLTVSDEDEGPSVDHYLVAIAEAGSLGASLELPLHERFQQALLRGDPEARADWAAIRRAMAFYAWDLPRRYQPIATVGVVTADPLVSFEMTNLLTRHNVPFALVDPSNAAADVLRDLSLVIVVDAPGPELARTIDGAEARGVTVIRPDGPVIDPNAFALDVRNQLGPERRVVDVWNGITVLVTPWRADDGTVMLGIVNYASETRPIQVRVRGIFATVHAESPEHEAMLIPFTSRDGFTEFVLPDVRIGARVFLTPHREAPAASARTP